MRFNERVAIVSFLRAQAQIAQEKADAAVQPPENERLARDYFAAKISLNRAADAVENELHLKKTVN